MIRIPCRKCGSTKIRKNGHTKVGDQKYHCQGCGFYGTLHPHAPSRTAQKALVARLALERVSQRAIARITGLSRNTVIAIVKKT